MNKKKTRKTKKQLEKEILDLKKLNKAKEILEDSLRFEINRLKVDKKQRYEATVYCGHCQKVNSVSIPIGVKIGEADCITCRVRGELRLVRD